MKFNFRKNVQGDIEAEMQIGTNIVKFNYVVMLKALIDGEDFEPSLFEGIEEKQQVKITKLLNDIKDAVKNGNDTNIDEISCIDIDI